MRACGGALHGCEECGAIADVREKLPMELRTADGLGSVAVAGCSAC